MQPTSPKLASPVPTDESDIHLSSVNNRYRFPTGSDCFSEGTHIFARATSHCQHTDWDLCEMIRLQELGEVNYVLDYNILINSVLG